MTAAELEDLVRRFRACEVPRPEWTHTAHLAVGMWHVSRYGAEDALARLRDGIRRLNESNGVVNSSTSGYHETITWAYVQLLAAFAARHADAPVVERVTRLLASELAARSALLEFYSRPRLESTEARLALVEPDLAPLALDALLERSVPTVRTHGLTHIALAVKDPQRSLAFYQRVFGVKEYYRDGTTIQVQGPGPHDVLAFERKPESAGAPGGIIHFGFRLTRPEDVDAAAAAVQSAGGTVTSQGEFAPGVPYLFVRDPDGYEIEIWYE